MINVISELEKHKLDPGKLTLEALTTYVPSYFKSKRSGAIYQWAALPCVKGWGVTVYLFKEDKCSTYHHFMYPELQVAICHMLLWLLDNDIVSYHQLIDLL